MTKDELKTVCELADTPMSQLRLLAYYHATKITDECVLSKDPKIVPASDFPNWTRGNLIEHILWDEDEHED